MPSVLRAAWEYLLEISQLKRKAAFRRSSCSRCGTFIAERGGMPQRFVSYYYPFWAPPPLHKDGGLWAGLADSSCMVISITQINLDVNIPLIKVERF
jgi:ribosomal protein S27AE